ncbi:MAG: ABC transporter substrate-binding protein [Alphaproteobacteria bacterium]
MRGTVAVGRLGLIAAACWLAGLACAQAQSEEPPLLAPLVADGSLPPMAERLPAEPAQAEFEAHGKTVGQYGGDLRLLFGRARDSRLMSVYGYARLVGFTPELEIVPDILAGLEVEEGRIFTMTLRQGHRWSDGAPFTSEDFRYWWEDVALNEALSPVGPPIELLVDGELPTVEFPDQVTVRYGWSKPNPSFLPALAAATPLYIFMPAHYVRQFHEDYGHPEEIADLVARGEHRNWAALHNSMDNLGREDNPALPTLEPWRLMTEGPSDRLMFERNPFYHRVDPEGRQLPYIDRVIVNIAAGDLIAAKTATGDSDLQARNLSLADAPLLKQNEAAHGYTMALWGNGQGSRMALFPNLHVADPVWREVLRDVRFRRALSLAVDREDLNAALYFNLAVPGGNTILPQSPLYDEALTTMWATLDYDQANALLDEMGLDQRNARGIRLLPDGRPLEIIVETTGEDSEVADLLELIGESWRNIGVAIFIRPQQREAMYERVFAGETVMSAYNGIDNGIPTADMAPWEFAPTAQDQLQWPRWGQFHETKGAAGEPIDMPEPERLMELYREWRGAADMEARHAVWSEMVTLYTDSVFTIGTVAQVPQPVVISNRLHNVPRDGIYNWDPGAHFGIYRPDTFWLEQD